MEYAGCRSCAESWPSPSPDPGLTSATEPGLPQPPYPLIFAYSAALLRTILDMEIIIIIIYKSCMNKKCWDSVHKIFFIHYVHKSAVKNARKKIRRSSDYF